MHPGLILVHAAATCMMTGLIWFVQIVHYPLFRAVDAASFVEYERRHQRRTSVVIIPLMLVELGAAMAIVVHQQNLLTLSGAALLAIIWLSTFVIQTPLHQRLLRGADTAVIRRLVVTNWVRTIAWSARAVIALLMLAGD